MDSRDKIVTPGRALAIAEDLREKQISFKVVTGYFDVLQPSIVRRLQEHSREGTHLFAVVLSTENTLLSDRARAELAAALRVIDYVIPSPGDPSRFLAEMQAGMVIPEEAAHRESTQQLIEHVFERHGFERTRRPLH